MAPRASGGGARTLLAPSRWPLRWRLTAVSSALTLVILILFAAVVGRLAEERLRSDFRSEIARDASDLAAAVEVRCATAFGPCEIDPELEQVHLPRDAALWIVDGLGNVIAASANAPALEPGVAAPRGWEVATRRVRSSPAGLLLRYGRDTEVVERTIDRVWLFLGAGALGGAVLAMLAGLAVASRAMRPIAALTATARRIASTRDPSLAMPTPASDDEIAELARTLDAMLKELDAARAETQQVVEAQREFVADASHELRTPLTSILANLELLEERLRAQGEDGEEAEIVGSALRSSRRMRRLVSDLLLLARADAGRRSRREEVDLAEVVEGALAEVRPVARDHQLRAAAIERVRVLGNPDELHRLVLNLLDNGVRHTPAGTTITVELRKAHDGARLVVSDDGPGLPPGMEQQVFARFVRGKGPADLSGDSGTGLGLAIVRAVASSHGGAVEAGRSTAGGARFVVELPALEGAPEPAPSDL